MIGFKALNDFESSGSEGEEDANRSKLTREAQEEDATEMYNTALKLLCDSRHREASAILEEILDSTYLNDDEDQTSLRVQLKLGCLKNLSLIYAANRESEDLQSAKRVLMDAVVLDPANVSLWTRLGTVCKTLGDYAESYLAYQRGLECSPSHWICIENLITLAYALGDYISCLHYCGEGLERDVGFVRGHVFRDEVLRCMPHLREACKSMFMSNENLSARIKYDASWEKTYLSEALNLIETRCRAVTATREDQRRVDESHEVIYGSLTKLTLADLCRTVFELRDRVLNSEVRSNPSVLRRVEILLPPNVGEPASLNEDPKLRTAGSKAETDEASSMQRRNRSQSDEKDNNSKEECKEKSEADSTASDKMTEDECSQSQLSQDTAESEPKKKRGKDVKWWQYEGKRRSQRVRGHVQLISQSSVKSERGFAETLKDLIPASLLCNEDGVLDDETAPKTQGKDVDKYFGHSAEGEDVKRFVVLHGRSRLIDAISELPVYLSRLTHHCNWPMDLVTLFVECSDLCRIYRKEHQDFFSNDSVQNERLMSEAFICLCRLEFLLDNCPTENIHSIKTDSTFISDLSFLEIGFSGNLKNEVAFAARYLWWLAKFELATAMMKSKEFKTATHYLKTLETLLSSNSGFHIKIATKSDNVINLEEVRKKIRFIGKLKNVNRITELHKTKNYDSLIETLQLCLTSEDYSNTDLNNRIFLADAYYHRGRQSECIEQCLKIVNPSLRTRSDITLCQCLGILEKICISDGRLDEVGMKEKRLITNSMISILTWNENKGAVDGYIQTSPWCILHSVLFDLEVREPALYMDEETTPNSVVLLQFAHEFLNRSNKCTLEEGKLLKYTIDTLLKPRDPNEHGTYEETKHCIEQAIFCLWAHPSKRSKIKYLAEHNSTAMPLRWSHCQPLYDYYRPSEIFEFDSYDTISSDVESLFQRILVVMPKELQPTSSDFDAITGILEGKDPDMGFDGVKQFPKEFIDIYYLLGDFNFKKKEWISAIHYYTYDLTIVPARFDSWVGIALARGDGIGRQLNACENYDDEDVLKSAQTVMNCFERALAIDPHNSKVTIEFGCFVFAMNSFCSRVLKQNSQLSSDRTSSIKRRKDAFLEAAAKSFVAFPKSCNAARSEQEDFESQLDELWIHHYMIGKVYEKVNSDDPEKFLNQYELAAKRMHEQGATYPGKINYYNPPELSVEALEIYYRIHASILSFVQKNEHSSQLEDLLNKFLRNASMSPFITLKQTKASGEDRRKKAAEENKKLQNEIKELLGELITKVEDGEAESDSSSTSTSDDENDTSTVTSSRASTIQSTSDEDSQIPEKEPVMNAPAMRSFSVAAFLKEEEMKDLQAQSLLKATDSNMCPNAVQVVKKGVCNDLPQTESKDVTVVEEDNKFFPHFKKVKYGRIVSKCLAAMEECIIRFPQHHKSYYRLASTYVKMGPRPRCYEISRDYLLGNINGEKKKINGLFCDRKPGNFFTNVWRNPVDDIDRPGSFPYHMAQTVQLLIEILDHLNDHQSLAEIGISLAKKPEPDKRYLFNSDREKFSQLALKLAGNAARRYATSGVDIQEAILVIYETYQKINKVAPKENLIGPVLLECYKAYLQQFGHPMEMDSYLVEHALRFCQQLVYQSKGLAKGTLGCRSSEPGSKDGPKKIRPTSSRRTAEKEPVSMTTAESKFSESSAISLVDETFQKTIPRGSKTETNRDTPVLPPKVNLAVDVMKAASLLKDDVKISITQNPVQKNLTYWTETLQLMLDPQEYKKADANLQKRRSLGDPEHQPPKKKPLNTVAEKKRIDTSSYSTLKQSQVLPMSSLGLSNVPIPSAGMRFDLFMNCLKSNKSLENLGMPFKNIPPLDSLLQYPKGILPTSARSTSQDSSFSSATPTSHPNIPSTSSSCSSVLANAKDVSVTAGNPQRSQNNFSVPKNLDQNRHISTFQSSRITSPFIAQATALTKPEISAPQSRFARDMTPPPAHFRARNTSEVHSGDEPEIIDLTSPNRNSDASKQRSQLTHSGETTERQNTECNLATRPSPNYPMPPKKKLHARSNVHDMSNS